jgi:predicted metal-binding membrane protein
VVVTGALAGVTALAWVYILRLAAGPDMDGMDMSGWRMLPAGLSAVMAPAGQPWTALEFAFTFAMWAVMISA